MRKALMAMCSLWLALGGVCFGQATSTLVGNVKDGTTGEVLEFATVVLAKGDSTVVAGAMTDEQGHFEIKAQPGRYILSVALIGYKGYVAPVDLSQNCDAGRIALVQDQYMLGEAVVEAQLPRTELKGDAVVTNISGSVLEHAGTAQDLMGKIPGMIQRDGKSEVIGRGEPVYYINGRRVLDPDELRSLMSEEVRAIEVVNNPGAAYGAEIKAVVRIKTIRRQGEGFGFALTSQAKQHLTCKDFEPSWSVLDLNYRKGNLDFIGKLLYWDNYGYQYADIAETSFAAGNLFDQSGRLAVRQHAGGTNSIFGVNWQINENHSVGLQLQYNGLLFGSYKEVVNEDVFMNKALIDNLVSENNTNMVTNGGWLGNLYYSGKADKLEIEFNTDFQTNAECNESRIDESSTVNPRSIDSSVDNRYGIVASKIVFKYPVWKGQIQAGAEESYVKTRQQHRITFEEIAPSESELRENNIAGFAEYFLPLNIGQLSAGVRYEHVDYEYDDITGTGDLERRQDNWFPSASFSTKIGKVALSASISGKTQRPGFWKLSNEMQYHSRFTYQTGDPTLKNEKYIDAAINANWKWLTFSTTFENIKDAIDQVGHPYGDDGITLLTYENMKSPINIYSAYVTAAPTIGCWSPQYTAGVRKQFFNIDVADGREPSGYRNVKYDTPMFMLQFNNAFRFRNDWEFSADYRFQSRMSYGSAEILSRTNVLDFSVQKSFFKDRSLTVRLSATDVLNRSQEHVVVDYGNFYVDQNNDHRNPAILLRVSYHFNTIVSKYKGTGAGDAVKNRF
ncbi:MAG: outer membrane beta-barrel protein [Bacteroidales bacterium]|nr:outer membrane beta-barrel protein [Bacteroidales bacterium]